MYYRDDVRYDSASVKSLQLCHEHPQKQPKIWPCIVTAFWQESVNCCDTVTFAVSLPPQTRPYSLFQCWLKNDFFSSFSGYSWDCILLVEVEMVPASLKTAINKEAFYGNADATLSIA